MNFIGDLCKFGKPHEGGSEIAILAEQRTSEYLYFAVKIPFYMYD